MPKLNTTIDNIELKSNKIISTSSASPDTWTDAQYPSAKTLLNIAHPVGSVLTTSTKEDPATTLGGNWKLIDKSFKDTYKTLTNDVWTNTNATLDISADASTLTLVDHSISIRLKLTPTVALTDTATILGNINLPALGISRLLHSVLFNSSQSDNGECSVNYSVAYDTGTITVNDVLNVNGTHTMAANAYFFVEIKETVSSGVMLDDFCDRFYWKRLA